jgi:hypothetical protein
MPPPPPPPDEVAIQVRKLRYEVRRLRNTVIVCTAALCVALGLGFNFNVVAPLVALAALAALLIACVVGVARLMSDGWDAVSMRWQRARWQAERNKPVEEDEKL